MGGAITSIPAIHSDGVVLVTQRDNFTTFLCDKGFLTQWIELDYIGLYWTKMNQNVVHTLNTKYQLNPLNSFGEETY